MAARPDCGPYDPSARSRTVGTTSAVYLIEPAFRLLFEADDTLPMDYIENVEQIMCGRFTRSS